MKMERRNSWNLKKENLQENAKCRILKIEYWRFGLERRKMIEEEREKGLISHLNFQIYQLRAQDNKKLGDEYWVLLHEKALQAMSKKASNSTAQYIYLCKFICADSLFTHSKWWRLWSDMSDVIPCMHSWQGTFPCHTTSVYMLWGLER